LKGGEDPGWDLGAQSEGQVYCSERRRWSVVVESQKEKENREQRTERSPGGHGLHGAVML